MEDSVEGAAPVVEPQKPAEPEVDWKARATEAEARADTHERQVAGLTKAFGDQIAENNQLVQAQAEALKTQDWTKYEALVKQMNEKAAQASIAAANQLVIDLAAASIEKVQKKSGKDFVTDPLFESARKTWRAGNYAQAAIEATEIFAQLADEKVSYAEKNPAKALSDTAARVKKETEEAMGKFDLGAGAEAGGVGRLSLDDLTKKNTRNMTPKELAEHSKALDVAMGFKSR